MTKIHVLVTVTLSEGGIEDLDQNIGASLRQKVANAIQNLLDDDSDVTDSYFSDQGLAGPEAIATQTEYISTLITGDPVSGFELYGLFESEDEAAAFGNTDANITEPAMAMLINAVDGENVDMEEAEHAASKD